MGTHISQFYSCSKVKYAAELYYIIELGKYLHNMYHTSLSLDGVILDNVLQKSEVWTYFRVAIANGWVDAYPENIETLSESELALLDPQKILNNLYVFNEVPFDKEDYKRRCEDKTYDYITPKVMQISMSKAEDDLWVWSLEGKDGKFFDANNTAIGGVHAYMSLISIVACVAVFRFKQGRPKYFGMVLNKQTNITKSAFTYLDILMDKTNCFGYKDIQGNFLGWFRYTFDSSITKEDQLQYGYQAWYKLGYDQGYLNRWYTKEEKLKRMTELDIKEGDFVMFYERNYLQQINYIKEIAGCRLAHITKITDTGIDVVLFNTVKPYSSGKFEFEDNTTIVKSMYRHVKPYENLNTTHKFVDFIDLGVEYCMYNELNFIVPLDLVGEDDGIPIRVTNGKTIDNLLVSQNDLIYWILKDYDYKFDEQRFLSKYFNGTEPIRTRYLREDTLDEACYSK